MMSICMLMDVELEGVVRKSAKTLRNTPAPLAWLPEGGLMRPGGRHFSWTCSIIFLDASSTFVGPRRHSVLRQAKGHARHIGVSKSGLRSQRDTLATCKRGSAGSCPPTLKYGSSSGCCAAPSLTELALSVATLFTPAFARSFSQSAQQLVRNTAQKTSDSEAASRTVALRSGSPYHIHSLRALSPFTMDNGDAPRKRRRSSRATTPTTGPGHIASANIIDLTADSPPTTSAIKTTAPARSAGYSDLIDLTADFPTNALATATTASPHSSLADFAYSIFGQDPIPKPDSMTNDEAFARQLQARYDAEVSNYPRGSRSRIRGSRGQYDQDIADLAQENSHPPGLCDLH